MSSLIFILIVITVISSIVNGITMFVLRYKYKQYFNALFEDDSFLHVLRDLAIMITPIINFFSTYILVKHLNVLIKDARKEALKFKKINDFNQTPLLSELVERLDATITTAALVEYTINSKYGFEMDDETLNISMKNGNKELTLNIIFKRKKISTILVIMTTAGTSIKMNTVHFYDAIHFIESNL